MVKIRAITLNPVNVTKDISTIIPDIIERIRRRIKSGKNSIVFIKGLPQTGKSNFGMWILSQLIKGEIKQKEDTLYIGDNGIVTFKWKVFLEIALNPELTDKVMVWDEVQQDVPDWWGLAFKITKQITDAYGFQRHVLIMISPTLSNIHGLIENVHLLCQTGTEWFNGEEKYKAEIAILEPQLNGNIITDIVQIKTPIPKVKDYIWLPYIEMKKNNYADRTKEWLSQMQGESIKPHTHTFDYYKKENILICKRCGIRKTPIYQKGGK